MEKRTTSLRGELKEIPLEALVVGQSQTRPDPNEGIEELAQSIAKQGLLEPIVVAPVGDGTYEILAGQRRVLAHQHLGYSSIQAKVLTEKMDEAAKQAISATENLVRIDPPTRAKINLCTTLYRRYGSIKMVEEETGIHRKIISQYVKFDQLVPELKKLVNESGLPLAVALQAQKAAETATGEVDAAAAVVFVKEMRPMTDVQRRNFIKGAEQDPTASVEEKVERGRKQPVIKSLVVQLEAGMHVLLSNFAKDEGENLADAAAALIEDGLTQRGYGQSEQ
jgi:ParB family chromosome partitioning protein